MHLEPWIGSEVFAGQIAMCIWTSILVPLKQRKNL